MKIGQDFIVPSNGSNGGSVALPSAGSNTQPPMMLHQVFTGPTNPNIFIFQQPGQYALTMQPGGHGNGNGQLYGQFAGGSSPALQGNAVGSTTVPPSFGHGGNSGK